MSASETGAVSAPEAGAVSAPEAGAMSAPEAGAMSAPEAGAMSASEPGDASPLGTGRGSAAPPGGGPPRRWITRTAAATEQLGAALAAELAPDGLLLLAGELGSGKTVLARGLAGALGIDPRQVLSPTFNLIREHRGGAGRMVHVDLYRLTPEEVSGLGLEEMLAGPGVKVVEWAERLAAPPAGPALALRLRRLPEAGSEAREILEVAPDSLAAPANAR